MRNGVQRIGALVCLLLLASRPAAAQVSTGEIFGKAADGTGAVLPGVSVTLSGSSLIQPLFGLWSDRRGAMWLLPAGVAVAGVGIALAADAPSYWLVLLLVLASGLGSAAYHPEGSKFPASSAGASGRAGWPGFRSAATSGSASGR